MQLYLRIVFQFQLSIGIGDSDRRTRPVKCKGELLLFLTQSDEAVVLTLAGGVTLLFSQHTAVLIQQGDDQVTTGGAGELVVLNIDIHL